MPRTDHNSFLKWINEQLGIRELLEKDLRFSDLKRTVDTFRKGKSDRFWTLEKNEKSSIFFEEEYRIGDFTSDEYDDGWIIIGYQEDLDEFYSSSIFLNNVLAYFRGIDPKDLLNDSAELYPIRTALAYANNLDGVLQSFSGYRGIQIIHRILHTKILTVFGPQDKKVVLSGQAYLPFFKKLFSYDGIGMSTQYPQTDDDRKYRLVFWNSDNTTIPLSYGKERLYFDQREYYDLQEMGLELTNWLNDVLA